MPSWRKHPKSDFCKMRDFHCFGIVWDQPRPKPWKSKKIFIVLELFGTKLVPNRENPERFSLFWMSLGPNSSKTVKIQKHFHCFGWVWTKLVQNRENLRFGKNQIFCIFFKMASISSTSLWDLVYFWSTFGVLLVYFWSKSTSKSIWDLVSSLGQHSQSAASSQPASTATASQQPASQPASSQAASSQQPASQQPASQAASSQ